MQCEDLELVVPGRSKCVLKWGQILCVGLYCLLECLVFLSNCCWSSASCKRQELDSFWALYFPSEIFLMFECMISRGSMMRMYHFHIIVSSSESGPCSWSPHPLVLNWVWPAPPFTGLGCWFQPRFVNPVVGKLWIITQFRICTMMLSMGSYLFLCSCCVFF